MAYLTKPQAAEMLQISVRTLEGLIKRGQLPAYKIGPQLVRIDQDDLRAFYDPAGDNIISILFRYTYVVLRFHPVLLPTGRRSSASRSARLHISD